MTLTGTRGRVAALLIASALSSGCAGAAPSSQPAEEVPAMRLESPAFPDGSPIPAEHSRGGGDASPPLAWSGAPDGTNSFVLTCIDRSANDWVHWLVVDIPGDVTALASGASLAAMPTGSRELANTFGSAGWGGPSPPAGSGAHTYEFTIHALDVASLDVADTASATEVATAMRGHILASGTLDGTYER